ncbi:hypothetical protein CUJ83_11540 [Methanocella sp. CWC-04]|uniref:histidine kinase n=1 Tax=Methanooceanicella nereidis TaxID=2052831 RepID=A0AAP2RGC1_9EURY|nr:PAS domain-containing sensor histidine kinase [Methanocella sp. CWC-04]MCD1295630.1 hypothetical protein [Methanocella sp. CWC-04]
MTEINTTIIDTKNFRSLLDAVNSGIIIQDHNYIITYANRSACELFEMEQDFLMGRRVHELPFYAIHEDGSPFPGKSTIRLLKLMKGEPLSDLVLGINSASKKIRWLQLNSKPTFYDGTNSVKEIVTTFIDVTDKKRAEGDLHKVTGKIFSILDSMSSGFIIFDNEWRFSYVNTVAERIIGKDKNELLGNIVWDVFPGIVGTELYIDFFKDMSGSNTFVTEKLIPGDNIWLEIMANKHDDGISVFIQDITERKSAGEKIRQMASIVESCTDAIISLDKTGSILSWNEGAARIYGYTAGEMVGCPVDRIIPEDRRHDVNKYLHRILSGENFVNLDTRRMTKNRDIIDISLDAFPILNSEGEITGVSTIARNITDSKQAEKRIQENEEKYRSLINDVLDRLTIGFFILDRDFRVVWINQTLETFFGIKREDVLGKDKKQMIRERIKFIFEHPENFESKVLSTYSDNTYVEKFECHIIPSGERKERWLEHWSQPVSSGIYAGGRIECYTDISKRKVAEMELYHANSKMINILESISDAFFAVDDRCRIVYLNPEAERIFSVYGKDLAGKNLCEEFPELSATNFCNLCYLSMKEKVPVDFVDYLQPQNIWVEGHAYPASDGLSVYLRDITDRKLAEKEVERKNGLMQNILEKAPFGIYVVGETGNIEYVNPAMIHISGDTYEQFEKLNIFELETYDEIGMSEMIKSALQGEPFVQGPVEYTSHYGKKTNIRNFIGIPMDDNGKRKVLVFVEDITDRKKAENALIESEERYRTLAEAAHDMIFICDGEGRILYINDFAARKLKRQPKDLIGKCWNDVVGNDRLKDHLCSLSKVIASCEPLYVEEEVRTSKGRFWLGTWLVPIKDAQGYKNSFLGISRDITQLKLSEMALYEAKRQAELYVDLMGHDINNMNQIALGYLELALEMLDINGDESVLLAKPYEMLKNSSRLIDNVRMIQKAKVGNLKKQVIDIGKVLDEVRNEYLGFPGVDVTINYVVQYESNILANELIKDVFMNLVGNSIKHSNGLVTIDIRINKKCVDEVQYYEVTVEDNGPGIPDSLKSKLFNRLNRGNTGVRGSGLGLYLVKMLLDDFNGKVWIEDRVTGDYSKGCRFVILLPSEDHGNVKNNIP